MIKEVAAGLLDFLFPPHCPLCHAYVERRGGWCPRCLQQALQPHILPLSVPVQAVIAEAWALAVYRDSLRDLIRHLKYQGQRSNLSYIETLLTEARKDRGVQEMLAHIDVAVPVPLYPAKEKSGASIRQNLFSVNSWPVSRFLCVGC